MTCIFADDLKSAIFAKWDAPKCQQLITGLNADNDNQRLKDLNLPSDVQLSVCLAADPNSFKNVNGVNEKM